MVREEDPSEEYDAHVPLLKHDKYVVVNFHFDSGVSDTTEDYNGKNVSRKPASTVIVCVDALGRHTT